MKITIRASIPSQADERRRSSAGSPRRSRSRSCRPGCRARPRRAGLAQRLTHLLRQLGHLEPRRLAGVGAHDPRARRRWSGCRPAGPGSGWLRAARRRRAARRGVSVRITPACSKSASTVTSEAESSAPVCELVARSPATERPLLTATIGISRPTRRATREKRPRVAEGLDVEQRDVGRRVLLPVLEQVVGGDVGAVADRGEGGDAEAAVGGEVDQGEPERAALGDEADVAGRRGGGGEGGVEASRRGRVERSPEAVGADQPHPRARGRRRPARAGARRPRAGLGEARRR